MNIVSWAFIGYNMIIIYAALRSIPTELYEAARVDGASEVRIAWSIKIPAIRPALLLTVIFSVIGTFQLFTEPKLMFSLAPNVIGTAWTPESLCLQRRLRQPGRQLRRGSRLPARHRDHDRLLHRPAHQPTEGAPLMSAITTDADTRRSRNEFGRRPARKPTSWLLTVFVLICVGYFLLPLFWLVVASTKSNADLFSTLRPLVRELQPVREHQDRAHLPGRRVRPLGAQLGHLRGGQRSRRRASWRPRPATPSPSTSSRAAPRLFAIILGAIMIPARRADRADLSAVRSCRADRHLLGDHPAVPGHARSACS